MRSHSFRIARRVDSVGMMNDGIEKDQGTNAPSEMDEPMKDDERFVVYPHKYVYYPSQRKHFLLCHVSLRGYARRISVSGRNVL